MVALVTAIEEDRRVAGFFKASWNVKTAWNVSLTFLDRANSFRRLLLQGRPRDGQDRRPRPEDEPSVRFSLSNTPHLATSTDK